MSADGSNLVENSPKRGRHHESRGDHCLPVKLGPATNQERLEWYRFVVEELKSGGDEEWMSEF